MKTPDSIQPPMEPKKEEGQNLSLLTDFEAACNAVLEIEATAIGGREPTPGEGSPEDIKGNLFRIAESLKEDRRMSGFEGYGGFNRYRVLEDGTVCLLESHSFEKCIEKAHQLGIKTVRF